MMMVVVVGVEVVVVGVGREVGRQVVGSGVVKVGVVLVM